MDNLACNRNRRQFRAALVACRDGRSKVLALARQLDVDTSGFLLLSRADDPTLRTIDEIVAALPPSVTHLALDDAEYLLPDGERTVANVAALLQSASLRYAYRELKILATMSSISGQQPTLFRIR